MPKEDVVTLLKTISEGLGLTLETTTAQTSLQDALVARTDEIHGIAKDLSSQVKANEDRTTRLELDVGKRTADSGTRSLLQQATATAAEDVPGSMFTKIDRMELELKPAPLVEFSAPCPLRRQHRTLPRR